MKPETLLEWSRNPASMPSSAVGDLQRCIQAYPCFYTARMLYLKILRQNEDLDYASELFQTSLSSPDRRQLFYFIRKDELAYEEPERVEECAVEKTSDKSEEAFSLIDRYLDADVPASPSTPVFRTGDSLYSVEMAFGETQEPADEEGLLHAIMTPSVSESDREIVPRIPVEVNLKAADAEDAATESFAFDESGEMPEASFTLTLAKIYLKQKKYGRTLEILRTLVLKNPEKSIYFADQIKYLERIINHLNK